MWADKPIKYLGHYIHSSNDEVLETEWEQIVVRMAECRSGTLLRMAECR